MKVQFFISKSRGGFTLVEILLAIVVLGILMALLLPALAKTKMKSMRMKCANNLKTIGVAFNGFSSDNDGRYPHALPAATGRTVYGHSSHPILLKSKTGAKWGDDPGDNADWDWGLDIERLWGPLVSDLGDPSTLLSPCDPESKTPNDIEVSEELFGLNFIKAEAQSYAVHLGSDFKRPTSILALTRNFVGSDSHISGPHPAKTYEGTTPVAWGSPAFNKRTSALAVDSQGYINYHGPAENSYQYSPRIRYLCKNDLVKLGNPAFYLSDIPTIGFLGPEMDIAPDKTFLRGDKPHQIYRDLVMSGLSVKQGQILYANGKVEQGGDIVFRESVENHHKERGGIFKSVVEAVTQPGQDRSP